MRRALGAEPVQPLLQSALGVAMEWGIPAIFTALGAWLTVRHRAIIASIKRHRARREALDTFVHDHMPALVEFMAGSKQREEKATARETRITTQMQSFGEHLSRQDVVLDSISAQLWAAARFDVQARFQCDNDGRNIAVNAAYAKLMRVSEFELADHRWKARLVEDDAERYLSAVRRCFDEHRRYEGQAIFKRGDGTLFRAHVRIEPHPEDPADLGAGKLPTWFGSVQHLEDLPA